MQSLSRISFAVVACILCSCAATRVGDVRVYGLFGTPSADEIRAVIEANPTNQKIYEIQAISSSELHVYYQSSAEAPGYAIVKRVNGKWCYIEQVVFTS